MPNLCRSLLFGGIEPLTIVGIGLFSLVPCPKESSPLPEALSELTRTPLARSAEVPVPAPLAFVDQSAHGDSPSTVRFAPAVIVGFLTVPPTIGASISKLLWPPSTPLESSVLAVAHAGVDGAPGPAAKTTGLAAAAASVVPISNQRRAGRRMSSFNPGMAVDSPLSRLTERDIGNSAPVAGPVFD